MPDGFYVVFSCRTSSDGTSPGDRALAHCFVKGSATSLCGMAAAGRLEKYRCGNNAGSRYTPPNAPVCRTCRNLNARRWAGVAPRRAV